MIFKLLRSFIPIAFLATMLCGLVYLSVQQSLRTGANDPQIQMAEDAALRLEMAQSPQEAIAAGTNNVAASPSANTNSGASAGATGTNTPGNDIDIAKSLLPYLVIYDNAGNPIAGNGTLNGALPNLPQGVFPYTMTAGEDRFTWQPAPGIREAVVLVRAHGPGLGFAMAGRSLRDVETSEDSAGAEALAVWLATIVGLFAIELIFLTYERRHEKRLEHSHHANTTKER